MSTPASSIATPDDFSPLDRALRRRTLAMLDNLQGAPLRLVDALGTHQVGSGAVSIVLDVQDPGFYRALAMNGSVGAAESYMDGHWQCNDLVALVRLLVQNRAQLDAMETGTARLGAWAMRVIHALRPNSRSGAKRNIAAHYDLGNAFFKLFLSDDLMYSSALFDGADDTLEAASQRKLARICEKLQLRPGDTVAEIGTGWGGFTIYAATHFGCHITSVTISKEQHALATQRVQQAGLSHLIDVQLCDYRDFSGQFDKLVSIEMVEAIGAAQLPTYFGQIGRLLKPDGLALVQAITIEDHRYRQALRSVDFIKRHVFPGCFIPSINAMLQAKTASSDLALVHLEDFGSSYARTLHEWRQRFMAALPQVRAQGFDARFIRLWEFYLAYCEGGFAERSIGVAHLLLAKPLRRGRDYLPGLPSASEVAA